MLYYGYSLHRFRRCERYFLILITCGCLGLLGLMGKYVKYADWDGEEDAYVQRGVLEMKVCLIKDFVTWWKE
jgi:hypothetical protein